MEVAPSLTKWPGCRVKRAGGDGPRCNAELCLAVIFARLKEVCLRIVLLCGKNEIMKNQNSAGAPGGARIDVGLPPQRQCDTGLAHL